MPSSYEGGGVRKRVPERPDVPTIAEAGGTAFDGGTTLGEQDLAQKLKDLGATVRPSTSNAFAAFLKTEDAGIGDLTKMGLLKPE